MPRFQKTLLWSRLCGRPGGLANGTIFSEDVNVLVYAENVDIIGHTKRVGTTVLSAIKVEYFDIGLALNKS